jgi:hypothetical protein
MTQTPGETTRLASTAWPDVWRVAGLVLLGTAIHSWLIVHAEAPARDGIAFIRYALQLERAPWPQVVVSNHHHPLYPLTVLAVSVPVRFMWGDTTCASMLLSAQLAAALAGVFLVVPMYFLGKRLFNRQVGFWAAALFQCLPVSARISADTLSDPLCLLFAASALWLGFEALNRGSACYFAGCGLCSGLAYLARPEGLLPAVSVGLVLLGLQATAQRRLWRQVVWGAASLALAALLVGVPFIAVTGRLTTKPTGLDVLHFFGQGQCSSGAALWAVSWVPSAPGDRPTLAWGLWALASEAVRAFQYLVWLPAVVGLWQFRERFRSHPGAWALVATCVLLGAVLLCMTTKVGYLGERHVQLLVLCGSFWAVAAVAALGDRLAACGFRWATLALLAAVTGFGLPTLARPQHGNYHGYRRAGEWLALHAAAADPISDPHGCAYFYAGRVFSEGAVPPAAPGRKPVKYLVVELSQHSPRPNLKWKRQAEVMDRGTVVFRCSTDEDGHSGQEVVVFGMPTSP